MRHIKLRTVADLKALTIERFLMEAAKLDEGKV